ncbi:MAG: D-fructose-6-phosphate amidotransferase [Acidobacteria bacterium 13_1_40CM_4_69_4]|nr:MAG: D-fructose-6-phosphate amidotransferase [Acidobacteria bacterium 13_1_40CM_4_69_4]
MAAYVIADVEITDPVQYAAYIRVVPPTIAHYGGRFLVRGGKAEMLEGSWSPRRVVVLEFPSFEQARRWWASEEYSTPKALRQAASVSNLILVEGV